MVFHHSYLIQIRNSESGYLGKKKQKRSQSKKEDKLCLQEIT